MRYAHYAVGLVLLIVMVSCSTAPQTESFGDLTINVAGLPASIDANIAVTGPDDFIQIVNEATTLTNLPAGTYDIQVGNATGNATTYTGEPLLQKVVVPGSVDITYSNISDVAILASRSDCAGVAVGSSCTISVEIVNNTERWSSINVRLTNIEHFEYLSATTGSIFLTECGEADIYEEKSSNFIRISNPCGANAFSGNGLVVDLNVTRTAAGLAKLTHADAFTTGEYATPDSGKIFGAASGTLFIGD